MNRRDFSRLAGLSALGIQAASFAGLDLQARNNVTNKTRVPVGLCNHALRGMKLKAKGLIEYAMKHRLDSVQFNTLTVFESLDEKHLKSLYKLAKSENITIYVGAGSICTNSESWSDRFGNPEELVKEGIRVASILGSPIVGVRIGSIKDRYTDGGIRPKMKAVIEVMKSCRSQALDVGVKFSFENHSGDLRTHELLEIIEETGTDVCGAFYDPGNAITALEDPMKALEVLGKHINCTSVRDYVIWPTEDGAAYQWTAIGEGIMDYKYFTGFLATHCPDVPMHVETISNMLRPVPYLTAEFWEGFPDLKARDIVDFLRLLPEGKELKIEFPPEGMDPAEYEIKSQEIEFLNSIAYLKQECFAGRKEP